MSSGDSIVTSRNWISGPVIGQLALMWLKRTSRPVAAAEYCFLRGDLAHAKEIVAAQTSDAALRLQDDIEEMEKAIAARKAAPDKE